MAEENFIWRDGRFFNEKGEEVIITDDLQEETIQVNENNNSDGAETFQPGFLDLTSEFQLADIPQERSGLFSTPLSGFDVNMFNKSSYGNTLLDLYGATQIIPNLFNNKEEEKKTIVPIEENKKKIREIIY